MDDKKLRDELIIGIKGLVSTVSKFQFNLIKNYRHPTEKQKKKYIKRALSDRYKTINQKGLVPTNERNFWQWAFDDVFEEVKLNQDNFFNNNGKLKIVTFEKKFELFIEILVAHEIISLMENELQNLKPQPEDSWQFSVLEWATIFYYADETKLLSGSRIKKERMKNFMTVHNITTTYSNLKTKYYDAMKRINKKSDYPIVKLYSIIPFLEGHYPESVIKVKNDIIILNE